MYDKTISLVLLLLYITAVAAYNINNEQSKLFKKAISTSLKKPPATPLRSSATGSIVQSRSTVVPIASSDMLAGPPNYWFHPKIHTFGNTGVLGGLHAAVAPFVTMLIDKAAYDGENVRDKVAKQLRSIVGKEGANVVDLCCGVGISTRALRKAFSDANTIIGVDTSKEMIAMAEVLSANNLVSKAFSSHAPNLDGACDASYTIGNAELTNLPDASFDLVTIMYAFHEAPYLGRYRMLREGHRLLSPGGTLAVIDISPKYQPGPTMLAGEPYVLEYKKNIHKQMMNVQGFESSEYSEVVDGHVGKWILTKTMSLISTPIMNRSAPLSVSSFRRTP
ncbi:methyltransferase domain-containing protein [Fragilaria crotonensis]|nr:methyltransferase domain-containing protein [Fragilaria crotonensis]